MLLFILNRVYNWLFNYIIAIAVFIILFSKVAVSQEIHNVSQNTVKGIESIYNINYINKLEPLKTLVKEKHSLQHPFSRVLQQDDIVNYLELLRITTSQNNVNWQNYEEIKKRIKDPILIGIMDYEKYTKPTVYKASFNELNSWLSLYKGFPESKEVYQLIKSKFKGNYSVKRKLSTPNSNYLSYKINYNQNNSNLQKSSNIFSSNLLQNFSNIIIKYPVSLENEQSEIINLERLNKKHVLAKFSTSNKTYKTKKSNNLNVLKTFVLNSSDIVTSFSNRDLVLSKRLIYSSKRYQTIGYLLAYKKSKKAIDYYTKYIKGKKLSVQEISIIRARMTEGLTLNSEFAYTTMVFKHAKNAELTIHPEMYWWTGLSYYALKDYANSALLFKKHAQLKYIPAAQQARSWYWSALSFANEKRIQEAKLSLKKAALSPSITLYGFLAKKLLDRDSGINWDPLYPNISKINNKDTLKRVLALIEVGLYKKADTHLSYIINPRMSSEELAALSSFAEFSNLPMSSYRAASFLFMTYKIYYTRAMYPIPFWTDKLVASNYVDPLLTLAVTRQESAFKYNAVSKSGAMGLMQLMPFTASYVSGKRNTKSFRQNLFGININVELGSKYLSSMLSDYSFNDSIIHAIASYNAGPGRLKRQKIINNNPLFFLELIPIRETRDYANFVLTNYLVYRDRIDISKDEVVLDLLTGNFPTHLRGLYYTERTLTKYTAKSIN